MNLPKPKAIIFDWDNTLVNTWPVIHAALHDTFTEMGHKPWTLQETKERVKKSMRDSFPELFGEGWQKAGQLYQDRYKARHLEMLEALPGAVELLTLAVEHGIPTLVVSNKKGHTLRAEVKHLGWDKYFSSVVGSDDAARDKPHPDPVHLALSHLEMPAGPEIWFVGDSEVDLEAAAAAGCTPILFGDFAPTRPGFTPTHYLGFAYSCYACDHAALLKLLKP